MRKFSRKRKFVNHKKRILHVSLFFIVLFISIGYAYLNAALSINGNTTIGANTWDIHFANLDIAAGSATATTPAAINNNSTSISYTVLLSRPGDYYEFEVDTVNAGTIPAKVSLVDIQGISSAAEPYLEYSINYTSGIPVRVNDLLNPGSSKRIVVRVGYIEDLNSLPAENIPLNLTFSLNYGQTTEEENVGNLLQRLSIDKSCITKYDGQVTDRVGVTETATNVYLDKCADKRNVIFGGFCWQIIRSTESGGLKMIYYGEPENGKCESTRGYHYGITHYTLSNNYLNSSYLYGSKFTYDISSRKFTLLDTFTETWSDSTYKNLIGKYTCRSNSNTCSTMYMVNDYRSSNESNLEAYSIQPVNYAIMGDGSFNVNRESPAKAGYMYNRVYTYKEINPGTNEYKYANSFIYDEDSNSYTLTGENKMINDWTTGYKTIGNTHYTCWNDTGTCSKISYIIDARGYYAYYIELENGNSISDALNEMLYDENVNKYSSSAKGIIDNWYEVNLLSKTNMLEDVVFCDDRTISSLGSWNPSGGIYSDGFRFKSMYTNSLICSNETDQFAVGNNKAKLTYPVGLLRSEEYSLFGNNEEANSLRNIGTSYWVSTPTEYGFYVNGRIICGTGGVSCSAAMNVTEGLRPVVSLAPFVVFSSGTGSEADPWIVE